MKYRASRGTRDILPEEAARWEVIENAADAFFPLYNFAPIRTPILEQTELFVRSIGAETDIVGKEMYTLADKGGRSLTLRPEGTAGVIRAWLENNLAQTGYNKLYYQGPMFRQERPQAGRLRQFHQLGCEWFGTAHPAADAQLIDLAVKYLDQIGLEKHQLLIASVGCPKCRPDLNQKIKEKLKAVRPQLCSDCQKRYDKNPLRILDCKNEDCQKYIASLPPLVEALCPECQRHFSQVQEYLKLSGQPFQVTHQLVRGLDYYTRTTFEITSPELGAKNTLCGGGRYDGLVKELGGPDTPAVGLAFGLERLLLVLAAGDKSPEINRTAPRPAPLIFLVSLGEKSFQKFISLAGSLRQAGYRTDFDPDARTLKAGLRSADRQKAALAVIAGDDELAKNTYLIKDMTRGTQVEVNQNELAGRLEQMLKG